MNLAASVFWARDWSWEGPTGAGRVAGVGALSGWGEGSVVVGDETGSGVSGGAVTAGASDEVVASRSWLAEARAARWTLLVVRRRRPSGGRDPSLDHTSA